MLEIASVLYIARLAQTETEERGVVMNIPAMLLYK